MEGIGAGLSPRPGSATVQGRANRLTRVFHHWQVMGRGDLDNPFDIRHVAGQVDRNDSPGFGRDGGLDQIGVDAKPVVHVNEDGPGAQIDNGAGRGDERIRRRDDLISGADAHGA